MSERRFNEDEVAQIFRTAAERESSSPIARAGVLGPTDTELTHS